jgi:hypothetical protein
MSVAGAGAGAGAGAVAPIGATMGRTGFERQRERVAASFREAELINGDLFEKKDPKATEQYIFPNQWTDAVQIADIFHKRMRRVVSVQKKTKVGADGLMLALVYLLSTHIDDDFIIDLDSIRIITGMSNKSWEKDMKEKAPLCIKDKIFHHGALSRSDLARLRNSLLIIDEVDCADEDEQHPHKYLREANILNIPHLQENNIRLVFISATILKTFKELQHWGELHEVYQMTIPSSYIGHGDFLHLNILKEFYSLATLANSEKWIDEDILAHYGEDKRVHIARTRGEKEMNILKAACEKKGITFRPHTSDDRLTPEEEDVLFKSPLKQHVVLAVKGFFRRANLIPNVWKLRIGATHERYTKKVDIHVQVQGLPGRMTGYWRSDIEGGHKTGPHRTSLAAIRSYEEMFSNPYGTCDYYTQGFKLTSTGGVISDAIFCSPKNVVGLKGIDTGSASREDIDRAFQVFDTQDDAIAFGNVLCSSRKFRKRPEPALVPVNMRVDGANPTAEAIFYKFGGIDGKIPKRMYPTNDGKWIVYWRPSLVARSDVGFHTSTSTRGSVEEDDGKAAGGAGACAGTRR